MNDEKLVGWILLKNIQEPFLDIIDEQMEELGSKLHGAMIKHINKKNGEREH